MERVAHSADKVTQQPLTLTLAPKCQAHLRETLRQQILGDVELMRDIMAGREDPDLRYDIGERIQCLRQLGATVGLPENPERRREARSTVPAPPPRWKRHLIELIWRL